MTDGTAGPLTGLLVLDLSRVLAGPLATMMLADLGARVLKVERRGQGDDTRSWGPPFVGEDSARESTYFLSLNRNKESIELDFRDEGDLATLRSLVAVADVMVENFRPDVMARLGLAPADLEELNPRLVTLSISGFGATGPDRDRAGYDQILQGEAGIMSLTGASPDEPTKVGVPLGDILAGVIGNVGILAALHERETSGRGQVVRTSLLAALVTSHTFQATRWLLGGQVPVAEGNHHPTVCPYGAFHSTDGVLQIAVGNQEIWRRFAPLVGLDADDRRFHDNVARLANAQVLRDLITAAFGRRTTAELLAALRDAGVPAGEVRTLDQVYADPQLLSQGLLLSVQHAALGTLQLPGPPLAFSRTQRSEHVAPPMLGEHTDQVRSWLEGRGA